MSQYTVEEGRGTAPEMANTVEALERNGYVVRQLVARHQPGHRPSDKQGILVWTIVVERDGNDAPHHGVSYPPPDAAPITKR